MGTMDTDRRIEYIDDASAAQSAGTGESLAAHPHVVVVAPDLHIGFTHAQLDDIGT